MAGREPFLRDDTLKLVDYIKTRGCKVVVETTGSLLTKKVLSDFNADWLSFSIDSVDKKLCRKLGRGYLSKEKICEIIKISKKFKIKTKINTVVTRLNIDDIENIGKVLSLCPATVWKLRQFTGREGAAKVKSELEISTKKFYVLAKELSKKFPKVNIETKTSSEQSKTCFMIWPNGKVVVPDGDTHKIVGDIFEDEIASLWTSINFDQDIHKKNVEKTYKKLR